MAKHKKMWMLSVDWDTFIPEDPRWDFQHAETLMYATIAWLARGMYLDVIKTSGDELTFWDRVRKRTKYFRTDPILLVSDSTGKTVATVAFVAAGVWLASKAFS